MTKTVLILGASGKIGTHAARAFATNGWTVRRFNRATEDMTQAAMGCDVIVNGMNPPNYHNWAEIIPQITRDVLAAAPRREGADLLLSVPGVFAARAEGMAVGHRINLRGFDADHGQDIELSVGGLPINLPSHIHGQGYADLGFLIPEAVRVCAGCNGV